ncbi:MULTISPECIES: ECF transporter S component [unclassified Actinotalea]|uniref:ECF transporter S component n=1 Tax=unclassified Actinotalea TaxID=2638618 RepID=UPI002105921E|nr:MULTISPECIES: ECF transporter S component [unclassified Actinotalea]
MSAPTAAVRRAAPAVDVAALPLGPRTRLALGLATLAGILAFGWPLVLQPGSGLEHSTDAPLVLAVVLVAVVAVVLVALSEGGLDVKAVAVLGLLSAVGSVLRPLSAGTAGVELVFVVIVLGGRVFGPGFGFALGSTTILASALLTGGVGPWMPFQMLGASWIGLGAGLLPRRVRGAREIALLVAYGAVAAFAFGLAMNLSFWPFGVGTGTGISFVAGDPVLENLRRFGLFTLATSLGWDVGRALTTALALALVARPTLVALRRTAARAAFAPRRAAPAPDPAVVPSPGARHAER